MWYSILMNYIEALKRPCPHCGAEPLADCQNTQGYTVMPHKWRTNSYTAHIEPVKNLTLRQTIVLDLARKQIALNGHTTAKDVTRVYPTPNQYANIVPAMSRLVQLGYLALGEPDGRSRSFIQAAN